MLLKTIHGWTAIILFIIFLYSCIMWFWLSDDKKRINNASFKLFVLLEMAISTLVLILGITVLVSNPTIFSEGWIHLKILLGIITIGFIHISAAKTRKFLNNNGADKERKTINIFRVITIGLLMTTYTFTESAQDYNNPEKIKEIKTKILKI